MSNVWASSRVILLILSLSLSPTQPHPTPYSFKNEHQCRVTQISTVVGLGGVLDMILRLDAAASLQVSFLVNSLQLALRAAENLYKEKPDFRPQWERQDLPKHIAFYSRNYATSPEQAERLIEYTKGIGTSDDPDYFARKKTRIESATQSQKITPLIRTRN